MAAIVSTASGLWSAGGTWVGGVVPVGTDSVTIAVGHTVTVDGTRECGNDVNGTNGGVDGGLIVHGTLKADRAANNQLTLRCSAVISSTGTLDYGTDASIPTVTCTLLVNKATTPAIGKFSLRTIAGAKVFAQGIARVRNTKLLATAAAAATSAHVADATGWVVGDQVVFAVTGAALNAPEVRAITTITYDSGGTGPAVIGWTGGLSEQHLINGWIANTSSNVKITSHAAATPGGFRIYVSNANAAGDVKIKNVLLDELGTAGAGWAGISAGPSDAGGIGLRDTSTTVVEKITIEDCAFTSSAAAAVGGSRLSASTMYANPARVRRCAFYSVSGYAMYMGDATAMVFDDCGSYYAVTSHIIGQFSSGCLGSQWNRCCFTGGRSGSVIITASSFISGTWTECFFGTCSYYWTSLAAGPLNFIRCAFGVSHATTGGGGGAAATNSQQINTSGSANLVTMDSCTFAGVVTYNTRSSFNSDPSLCYVRILNRNADPTNQQLDRAGCSLVRDNALSARASSSIRCDLVNTAAQAFTIPISAPNSVQVRVIGYLRRNAAYGAATQPSVTLSGLGITPVSFTLSAGADAWQQFDLVATQTSGNTGNLDLTFTAQSANASASAWLDGVPFLPWVTWCNHYGYRFDPTNPVRTLDGNIGVSEATALAYAGLAWDGTTLTMSQDHSIYELYDWAQAYAAANRLSPFLVTADAQTYSLAGNLTQAGGNLTGSATLAIDAGFAHTPGSNTSDVLIDSDAGRTAIVTLTVPTGSAVVVNKTTGVRDQFTAASGATVVVRVPAGTTGSYTFTVAKYGKAATSGSVTVTGGGYLAATIALTDNVNVVEASAATVAAYTALSTTQRVYDYSEYFRTTTVGIDLAAVAVKAGATLDLGALNLAIDATAGVTWSLSGGTLTVKAAAIDTAAAMTALVTSGTCAFANGAAAGTAPITASNGRSAFLSLTGLTAAAVYIRTNAGAQHAFSASVTGTYTTVIPFGATGTWTWAAKRVGYRHALGNFDAAQGGPISNAPALPQKLNPDGSAMYSASSSALVTIAFTGTTQGTIEVGDGTAPLQAALDATEDALVSLAGMAWLASGKSDASQFNSAGGDYLFLSSAWRLRRRASGDNNATLNAFAVSADGVVVDGVNGPVAFLTSDSPAAIAAAVWAAATRTLSAGTRDAVIDEIRSQTGLIPALV